MSRLKIAPPPRLVGEFAFGDDDPYGPLMVAECSPRKVSVFAPYYKTVGTLPKLAWDRLECWLPWLYAYARDPRKGKSLGSVVAFSLNCSRRRLRTFDDLVSFFPFPHIYSHSMTCEDECDTQRFRDFYDRHADPLARITFRLNEFFATPMKYFDCNKLDRQVLFPPALKKATPPSDENYRVSGSAHPYLVAWSKLTKSQVLRLDYQDPVPLRTMLRRSFSVLNIPEKTKLWT